MDRTGKFRFFLFVLLMFFCFSKVAFAEETILVLHSYHNGYPWTDAISRGIAKVFDQRDKEVNIYVEYLDAKRASPNRFTLFLENSLRLKYKKKPPDIILCGDDDAFIFMNHAGRRLFPKVPVVFCGVNSRESLTEEIDSLTTGLIERLDIEGTINLALRLFPVTENVAVISDLSLTGMWIINQLRESMKSYEGKVNEINLMGLGPDDLKKSLRELPPQTIILLLLYAQGGEGEYYSPDEILAIIQDATDLPIFSVLEMMIERGTLAGSVLRGEAHGERAAKLAVEILDGKAPSSIPIKEDVPVSMGNYTGLKDLKKSLQSLPGDMILFGEPETFFYRHRRLIAINVAITSVLAILVIALLWNDKLLKREVLNLQSETEHLEKLFENSPHGTILINPRGEIMRANRAFLRMFGYGRKDVKGKDVDSLLAKAGDLLRHAQDLTIITGLGGVVSGRESFRLRKDGSLLPVMISGYPLVTKGMYRGSYGIYTDISARKNNEGAIRQHLRAEEIISSLSAALVKEKDFEQTILSSLHDLRLFFRARYMSVFLFDRPDKGRGTAFIRYEGEKEMGRKVFPLTFGETEPLRRTIQSQTVFFLEGKSPFTWDTEEKKQILETTPDETVILLPLLRDEAMAGCVCCVFVREKGNDHEEHISEGLLGIYSLLLGSALSRYETELALEKNLLLLSKTFKETFHLMSRLLEIKDPYTAGHQQKVAYLAKAIAERMELPHNRVEAVFYAALVHDIGKIPVPSSILSKPGRLSEAEFAIIKNHARFGAEILSAINFPWPIADIVLQHHEHVDGTGYPHGLKGDEISLEAKIVCVSDVVEAMSSFRPYRPALGIEEALEEIQKKRQIWFDSRVVDVCLHIFKETGGEFWKEITKSSHNV